MCLEAGANAYISKPFRMKDLVVAIEQWLAQPFGEPGRGACFRLYLSALSSPVVQVDLASEGDKSEADSAL
jgi:DNA-binding response OmpR family regulator